MYVSVDATEKVKMRLKGDQDGYASVFIDNIWKTEVACQFLVTQQDNFQVTPSQFNIKCDGTVEVKIRSKQVSNKADFDELS